MVKRCALVVLLAVVLVVYVSHGSDAKLSKKNALSARKEDVKFIKCAVCEEVVKQLSRQLTKKRAKVAPKKLTELEIIDLTENICNINKEEADWLMYLDIVEDGNKLKLVEQQEEGECNTECKTIERACQEVMGDHDTDVAEFMFKEEAQRSALSKLLCKDLSKACVGKPPPLPKNREPGERFTPKASKDAEMAKLMRSMSDMPGAPGMQMYSRDQLLSGGFGQDDNDDDDDDEEEEEVPRATEGHSLRSGLLEQLQHFLGRLKFGVQNAVDLATNHISKVSGQVIGWWNGSKKSSKRASKATSRAKSQKATQSEL